MLETLSGRPLRSAPNSPGPATPRSPSKRKSREASVFAHPNEVDSEAIDKLLATKRGQSTMRAHWVHGKSVSSAYWDPRGRSIVSTCYDDTIRRELSILNLLEPMLSFTPSVGHQTLAVRQGSTVPVIPAVQPNQAQLPDCLFALSLPPNSRSLTA